MGLGGAFVLAPVRSKVKPLATFSAAGPLLQHSPALCGRTRVKLAVDFICWLLSVPARTRLVRRRHGGPSHIGKSGGRWPSLRHLAGDGAARAALSRRAPPLQLKAHRFTAATIALARGCQHVIPCVAGGQCAPICSALMLHAMAAQHVSFPPLLLTVRGHRVRLLFHFCAHIFCFGPGHVC
eukprot:scaffold4306_cov114-Isochrysis_galbana.AAC.3